METPPTCSSPWFDHVRRWLGYRYPRLGPLFWPITALLPPKFRSEMFPQLWIDLDMRQPNQRCGYWQGDRYEYPTPKILTQWCEQATAFFDIGANYGFFTFLLAAKYTKLPIYAFDPHPMNVNSLQKTVALNRLSNIFPHPLGLSNQHETLTFQAAMDDSGHSTFTNLTPDSSSENYDPILAEVWPLDELLIQGLIQPPKNGRWVAKIDVEGFEMRVLQGMIQTLKEKRFLGLCIELTEHTLQQDGTSINEIEAYLRHLGYRRQTLRGSGSRREPCGLANAFFVADAV